MPNFQYCRLDTIGVFHGGFNIQYQVGHTLHEHGKLSIWILSELGHPNYKLQSPCLKKTGS